MIAAGLDACPGGWACVALENGRFLEAAILAAAAQARDRWPEAAAFGVDIPIGLAAGAPRRADLDARKFVGARWASVWLTPSREVLDRPWAAGLGVSRQAHGMGRRIREVEALGDARFREVHPEVVFAALAGGAPLPRKRSWAGVFARIDLLRSVGIEVPPDLALDVAPDDLLDAAVSAYAAHRVATGVAATLPADPAPGEPVISY